VADAPVPHRIALVVHPKRPVDEALAALNGWATVQGVDIVQLAVEGARHRELAAPGELEPGDLVVALGGDGTVLSALRAAAPHDAPVLGVACGSLGALTSVSADEVASALERVFAGAWSPRAMPALKVHAGDGPHEWAANDFVVVRSGPGQLVVELSVDGELYVRAAGDGLVVATPLGSSAYSMAAGGPILAADAHAFLCTPIAMHGGSAPPLVVPAGATATVVLKPGFAGFDAEVDGHDRRFDGLHFDVTLQMDKLVVVVFDSAGHGLTRLRKRGLVTDSPRILARDERANSPGATESRSPPPSG
jgi:NAD+ kinase